MLGCCDDGPLVFQDGPLEQGGPLEVALQPSIDPARVAAVDLGVQCQAWGVE